MVNSKSKQAIPFKLLSNLIVLPIEVNGKELNFILDSGVGTTILFNLYDKDSVQLNNTKKITLKGLGSEAPVDAILSKGNVFKLNNIIGSNQKLFVIFNDSFDLSSKLGITIHGIIGFEILKDFVVKVNYNSKVVTFYKSGEYIYKKCNKCEYFDLNFFMFKPYIDVGVKLNKNNEKITPVKLLIDSGGSDAVWLFETSHPDILPPTKYFDDFLGEGLSGAVYGKRSKIKSLVLGKFELPNPTVSFPDSVSVAHALKFKDRNGSLGATVLKRFVVIFDYKNNKLTLKKAKSFREPFRYNMSGIEIVHNGKALVKERDVSSISYNQTNSSIDSKITLDYRYKYTFKPTYKIHKLRIGSPAYNAGLEEGDIIIKINSKYTYNLALSDIIEQFYQKENTKINIVVERNGQDYQFNFKLKDLLK